MPSHLPRKNNLMENRTKTKEERIRRIKKTSAVLLAALAFLVVFDFVAHVFLPKGALYIPYRGSSNDDTSGPPFENGSIMDISVAKVFDVVVFGNYEQNNDPTDGAEAIEWIVLERQEDRVLLLSKYCLDFAEYNTNDGTNVWARSSLREWLCGDFYEKSFSPTEKKQIFTSLSGRTAPEEDAVTLLSINQAQQYFVDPSWLVCKPSEYAVAKGMKDGGDACDWWMLETGSFSNYGFVSCIDVEGTPVKNKSDTAVSGIRPVIWVSPNY